MQVCWIEADHGSMTDGCPALPRRAEQRQPARPILAGMFHGKPDSLLRSLMS